MTNVIATAKGYFGSMLRETNEPFAIPDEIWDNKKTRPSWVKLDPAFAGGGKVAAATAPVAPSETKPPAGPALDVPADWPNLHHSKRKALAKAISGEAVADLATADNIIAAYVEANKPAPFGDAPEPQTVAQAMTAIGAKQPDWIDPNAPTAVAD